MVGMFAKVIIIICRRFLQRSTCHYPPRYGRRVINFCFCRCVPAAVFISLCFGFGTDGGEIYRLYR